LTAIFDIAKSAWDSSDPAELTRMKISVTGLDIEVLGQLDQADVVVGDLGDLLDHLADRRAVGRGFFATYSSVRSPR